MALIQLTLEEVNSLPSNDFIKVFGNIIERYPTAAIKILKFRPFCKVDDLIDAFNNYLDGLNIVEKENVLKYQIDVTTKISDMKYKNFYKKIADNTMCLFETCSNQIHVLNKQYKKKFEMPFVICISQFSIISILQAMEYRMGHSKEEEIVEALDQMKKLVFYKIHEILIE